MRPFEIPSLVLAAALTLGSSDANAQAGGATGAGGGIHPPALTLELESGAVGYARNDVRIPNDGGTLFDLRDLTGSRPELYGRLALTWRFGDRHAPLRRCASAPRASSRKT